MQIDFNYRTFQAFPVELLILLYQVVISFESVNEILKSGAHKWAPA